MCSDSNACFRFHSDWIELVVVDYNQEKLAILWGCTRGEGDVSTGWTSVLTLFLFTLILPRHQTILRFVEPGTTFLGRRDRSAVSVTANQLTTYKRYARTAF